MSTHSVSSRLRFVTALARHLAAACVVAALVFGPAPRASASTLSTSFSFKLATVKGEAVSTITSLVFLNDTTLLIEADQVGHLSTFGDFTGHFSYVAVASPTSIALLGHATLTNDQGEQLFLAASILEVGADYPRAVSGTLTVTGGTGHFAGATGLIGISGTDEESLTDTFKLEGVLLTTH